MAAGVGPILPRGPAVWCEQECGTLSERAALTPLFEDACFRERAFQQLFVGDEK